MTSHLNEEQNKLAQTLLDLIPNELNEFKSNSLKFCKIEHTIDWLQFLYENRNQMTWPGEDRLREPEFYGFKDKNDAYRKMQLLKKAWEDIIDIKLDKSDYYVNVLYRLPPEAE